ISSQFHSLEALVQSSLVHPKILNHPLKSKLQELIQKFLPGPLTLILPKGELISDLITSGLDTVAIRMPSHPITQTILNQLGIPLAAPSANEFGKISPTTAQAVEYELGGKIPWILDGGAFLLGIESSILFPSETGGFQILRSGAIPIEILKEKMGEKIFSKQASSSLI